jgi:hypothetical protein
VSDSPVSLILLALFTSDERASEIWGDLREESQTHGRVWFWSHVVRTAGALCWSGFRRAPFRTVGAGLAGFSLFEVISLILTLLSLIPPPITEPRDPLVRIGIVFLSAFVTGLGCVRVAPVRGAYACVGAMTLPVASYSAVGVGFLRAGTLPLNVVWAVGTVALIDAGVVAPGLCLGAMVARRLVGKCSEGVSLSSGS